MHLFRVTHPFHPLCGQEFELLDRRQSWGEERVYYQDAEGRLKALPLGWTSEGAVDPAVAMGGGRACFRVVDLLELARVIRSSKL